MVNRARVTRRTGLRPRRAEREAWVGWKTVEERRKEVPAQKASMALPWRSWEMIWMAWVCVLVSGKGFLSLFEPERRMG